MTQKNPTVSVVIPAFNCRTTIGSAISSVLTQDFRDFEIIVVDDGSTDGTATALAQYADQISYVWQPNMGAAAARNLGISKARGEFVAFLDSDDEWYPYKLGSQLSLFRGRPHVGLVSGAARYVDASNVTRQVGRASIAGNLTSVLLNKNIVVTSSVLLRRSLLIELDFLFRSEFVPAEDWELWLRLSGRCEFIVSPEVMVCYHMVHDSLSRKHSGYFLASLYKSIYVSLLDDPVLCTLVKSKWAHLEANAHLLAACHQYDRGEHWLARKEVLRAIVMSRLRLNLPTAIAILFLPPTARNRLRLAVTRMLGWGRLNVTADRDYTRVR